MFLDLSIFDNDGFVRINTSKPFYQAGGISLKGEKEYLFQKMVGDSGFGKPQLIRVAANRSKYW
jgi:hypothetical protein